MSRVDSLATSGVYKVLANPPVVSSSAEKYDVQRCYCTAAVRARRSDECPPPVNPAYPKLAEVPDKWVAFRVRHQSEKMLSRALLEVGAPYAFPYVRERRVWGGEQRILELPTLPRTIVTTIAFVDFLHHPLLSRFVHSRIDVADKSQSRFIQEIEQACDYSDHCPAATPYASMMVKGRRVRVKSGPFMNYEGPVLAWNDQKVTFAIEVRLLGMARTLEIDGSQIEPLD
jgi:hypothetical protein